MVRACFFTYMVVFSRYEPNKQTALSKLFALSGLSVFLYGAPRGVLLQKKVCGAEKCLCNFWWNISFVTVV